MSSRKIREQISLSYVFRGLFKAPKRYLSVGADLVWSSSFLGCIFRFLFQAKLACFKEIHENVNDFVFRDKVE